VKVVSNFDNLTPAAANNVINGFGKCPPGNISYTALFESKLIREDGVPYDSEPLKTALAFEVNRRVDAGTFN